MFKFNRSVNSIIKKKSIWYFHEHIKSVFKILFSHVSVSLPSKPDFTKSNATSEDNKTIVTGITILDMEYVNRCIHWHLLNQQLLKNLLTLHLIKTKLSHKIPEEKMLLLNYILKRRKCNSRDDLQVLCCLAEDFIPEHSLIYSCILPAT